jgi:hypothetical protein
MHRLTKHTDYGSLTENVLSRIIVFNAKQVEMNVERAPPYILIQKVKVLLYIEYKV